MPIGEKVDYNSNPPTSGKHYEDWIRSGVYSEPKEDRNLVHSLEHGYVIISYNCDHKQAFQINLVPGVFAHDEGDVVSINGSSATPAAQLSDNFKSVDCKSLIEKLTEIVKKKGSRKLVVVPRSNLETRLALTAWNYLDKFDKLDISRVENFIDKHIDNGPEKTME